MDRTRVLAIIQAGGAGGRMDVLTRETPKPVLPFAGSYRLIDFPLSNLRNSGIDDVWLSVQYLAQELADAVANGKPWDLDRHHGGFKLVMPEQGSGSPVDEGFVAGNAEELLQNRDMIRQHGPDAVVVMSADHVYRLDYADVVEDHLSRDAECTVVTTVIPVEEAANHATVEVDDSGVVTGFAYKPDSPTTGTIATEVFVYSPGPLVEVLESLHRELAGRGTPDADGLGDFGEHLLPALVERGRVYAHPLDGYWRDLGRPETYVAAHRELLRDGSLGLFDDATWPMITNGVPRLPARVSAGPWVADSLLSPGCVIQGTVVRSVLSPGVRVAAGAVIRDSILMADVVVDSSATVEWAVVDSGCCIGPDAVVGEPNPDGGTAPEALTLVGRDSTVAKGVRVPRGSRLEPGTTA
jgi:glucose-1-phosphate adenylyltransferase